MIHQFRNNGYNIVLDVNSGSVHVVDDVVYDAVALMEKNMPEDEILSSLKDTYSEEDSAGSAGGVPDIKGGRRALFRGRL